MGAIKLGQYSPLELRNAELGRAIGAPARIVILRYLNENKRATGNDLKEVLNLQQPTIQQHISTLVNCGLIKGQYFGNEYIWMLNPICESDLRTLAWIFD